VNAGISEQIDFGARLSRLLWQGWGTHRHSNRRRHELWHFLGETAVHHVDLTAAYSAPSAADRPVLLLQPSRSQPDVAYRGTNGHIYELLW
jgi:hypothetical protein